MKNVVIGPNAKEDLGDLYKNDGSNISLHLHDNFVVTGIKHFTLVIGPNLYSRAIVTSIKVMAVIG